jgi:hypothetical protein
MPLLSEDREDQDKCLSSQVCHFSIRISSFGSYDMIAHIIYGKLQPHFDILRSTLNFQISLLSLVFEVFPFFLQLNFKFLHVLARKHSKPSHYFHVSD